MNLEAILQKILILVSFCLNLEQNEYNFLSITSTLDNKLVTAFQN